MSARQGGQSIADGSCSKRVCSAFGQWFFLCVLDCTIFLKRKGIPHLYQGGGGARTSWGGGLYKTRLQPNPQRLFSTKNRAKTNLVVWLCSCFVDHRTQQKPGVFCFVVSFSHYSRRVNNTNICLRCRKISVKLNIPHGPSR